MIFYDYSVKLTKIQREMEGDLRVRLREPRGLDDHERDRDATRKRIEDMWGLYRQLREAALAAVDAEEHFEPVATANYLKQAARLERELVSEYIWPRREIL